MYEQSAQPLENLVKFEGYFLIVILLIGAIILIVLNVFATRERKYEIGVLSAIGMKKARRVKLTPAGLLGMFMFPYTLFDNAAFVCGHAADILYVGITHVFQHGCCLAASGSGLTVDKNFGVFVVYQISCTLDVFQRQVVTAWNVTALIFTR